MNTKDKVLDYLLEAYTDGNDDKTISQTNILSNGTESYWFSSYVTFNDIIRFF